MGARPHKVDLDEDDDAVTILNKVIAPPVLVAMDINDQAKLIDEIISLPKDQMEDVAYDAQASMHEAFSRTDLYDEDEELFDIENVAGEVETDPLKEVHEHLERIKPATPKKVTFGGKVSKSKPQLKKLSANDGQEPTFSGFQATPKVPIPPYKPNDVRIVSHFWRGKNLKQKNTIYSLLLKWGIVREGEVKSFKNPDRWLAADIGKIIDRLISNTHAKLKKDPPIGFKILMEHIHKRPGVQIFELFGDNIRRQYLAAYPNTQLPKKIRFND